MLGSPGTNQNAAAEASSKASRLLAADAKSPTKLLEVVSSGLDLTAKTVGNIRSNYSSLHLLLRILPFHN